MHSHEIPAESQQNDYQQLRKKLLSHFKEMGAENRIEYSKESDDYFESNESEGDLLEKFVELYDNDVFWRELARRLASQEVIEEVGLDAFQKMDEAEKMQKLAEAVERYEDELGEHGFEHLALLKGKNEEN